MVDGRSGADVIGAGYVDVDGDAVDGGDGSGAAGNEDVISGHGGDDTISAGAEDDLVYGGAGADVIDGGDGDDTLYGGDGDFTDPMVLDWSAQGPDNTNLAAGFTQNTGGIDVTVSFTNAGNNNPVYRVESTDTTYVGPGESFDPNSSLYLYGDGDGATSTTTIDFAAAAGTSYRDEVENVTFRINDVDWGSGNHTDVITVNAWDADGNPVAVTITPGGGDTVSGNTITANAVANTQCPGRRFGADRDRGAGRRDPDQLRQRSRPAPGDLGFQPAFRRRPRPHTRHWRHPLRRRRGGCDLRRRRRRRDRRRHRRGRDRRRRRRRHDHRLARATP
ncbi:MAG: hypothetical protein R3D80_06200 [Paracoccaceae bacterium]